MAAVTPRNPLWVAVDTNVLLDLADDRESAWRAVETIRPRLPGVQIVVPPTSGAGTRVARLGRRRRRAAARTRGGGQAGGGWGFVPLNLIPVGHGITERIADDIRRHGFLPASEVNDSFVVAESALGDGPLDKVSPDGLLHDRAIPESRLIDVSRPCNHRRSYCDRWIRSPFRLNRIEPGLNT